MSEFSILEFIDCPENWDRLITCSNFFSDCFQQTASYGAYLKQTGRKIRYLKILHNNKVFGKLIMVETDDCLTLWKVPQMRYYDPGCIRVLIDYLKSNDLPINMTFSTILPQEEAYLFENGFQKKDSYWTIIIDPLRKDYLRLAMRSDRIRKFKNSKRDGLEITNCSSEKESYEFKENLVSLSNKKDPIYRERLEVLYNQPNVQVLAVKSEGRLIAGILCLITNTLCELRYNYTIPEFYKKSPITYLIMTMLYSQEERYIDLAGLSSNFDQKNLKINQYKNYFGGLIYEFKRFVR